MSPGGGEVNPSSCTSTVEASEVVEPAEEATTPGTINSRKITLVLNNHLEAMTFYGDDFRNMLGLEKANDLGDLIIKFEEDELCSMREYYYEFQKSCSFNY